MSRSSLITGAVCPTHPVVVSGRAGWSRQSPDGARLLGVVDERVDEAFAATPRTGFLPRRARRRAAYDGPIQIGHGQTNSQPRTVAAMLTLLQVRPADRVLDVGAGSG